MALLKTTATLKAVQSLYYNEDMEQRDATHTAGGSVNWCELGSVIGMLCDMRL